MKYFLFLLLALPFTGRSQARSVYFELGGPGVASVNFDTRFTGKESGLGGRIGFGGFSIRVFEERQSVFFIPIGINYLLGKDHRNYFEIGAGVTPTIVSVNDEDKFFSASFGHLLFGYRLQPEEGGFTFRGFFSPVFNGNGFLPIYGGVSFGYKF